MNTITPINNFKIKPIQYASSVPMFRANSATEVDSVELSSKKEDKHSKRNKYLAAGIISFLAISCGSALLVKRMHKSVEKLYDNKLFLSELPEKIEFKAAKSLDEAIKFTKEVLGIKNVDNEFTLEALNYANKGIVDVCNVNHGKLYMPSSLKYRQIEDDTLAYVNSGIHSNDFGELVINKKFFDNKYLDDYLKEKFHFSDGKNLFVKFGKNNEYGCEATFNELSPVLNSSLTPVLDKFYSDPQSLSLYEKLLLKSTIKSAYEQTNFKLSPNHHLNQCKKLASKKGIQLPFEEWDSLKTIQEKHDFIKRMYKKIREKDGLLIVMNIREKAPEATIYHEMGHLQDFGKNLKEIDLKQLETLNENLIDNRWGGLEYEHCKKIYESNKEEFKQKFPDLYEFITNEEMQETAGKVSNYAKSGIGEFIAETYALMIDAKLKGHNVVDDVNKLYEKLKGPVFN